MLNVRIPDGLSKRVNEFAGLLHQTSEEFIIELLEERIEHDSSYKETAYLAKSLLNKNRLDKAVSDIKAEQYEVHELLND